MKAQDFFLRVTEFADQSMGAVDADILGNQTACAEWDVRELMNHMVYELLWLPDLLAGKTVAEVGDIYEGDVLKNEPKKIWRQTSQTATQAVTQTPSDRVVHLSYGDVPAENYIREVATDILIHTWDLGKGLRRTALLPDELSREAFEYIEPRIQGYREAGVVANPINIAEDAPIAERLLALTGRRFNG